MSRTYSESTYRRISQLIAAYTDRLLIFLDPTERGQTLARYPFLNSFEHLTDFVGFVGPPEVPKREPTKGYWLATFGGGIDAFQKIWVTCDAFRRLNADFPGAALHLYTGRRLPSSAMSSLQQEFGRTPRLHLRSYRPRLYEEFGKAELLIAMAGYNTCVEIASLATGPVIALPRVSSTNQEQLSNALRFRSSGHISEVLLPQELTGPRLAAVVRSVLSKGAGTRREINLGGAAAAGKALVALPAQVSH